VRTDETDPPRRTWREVRALLDAADLDPRVAATAQEVFRRLAQAEARVHGSDPDDVHFHEVGAHDAIADVVGCAAGFAALGVDAVHVSPVALGGGTVRGAHGTLPVPGPAVLEILRAAGAPAFGGPVDVRAVHADRRGRPRRGRHGMGADARDHRGGRRCRRGHEDASGSAQRRPHRRRRLVDEAPAGQPPPDDALVVQANVDDLDPRLWPAVLARLLEAGASDAWLTPIVMKKGRPAHTLSVLVDAAHAAAVRAVVFAESSTLGLREHAVGKRALDRRTATVTVGGCTVRVKLGLLEGAVVNAQPEYDDVARAAGS
jgi:uncharacterized protein (DUF111 family)